MTCIWKKGLERGSSYSKVFFAGLTLLLLLFLLLIPTGFEGALQFKDAEKCRVLITDVDNSSLIDTGLIRTGQQICRIKFLSGKFKGLESEGWNMLNGSYENIKDFIG